MLLQIFYTLYSALTSSLTPFAFPPPLKSGDRLICIAPSGRIKINQCVGKRRRYLARERGYRVEYGLHWNAKEGYLAGSDQQRREALISAWKDPECKGILCIRGGYGSARLLEQGDWQTILSQNPKWLIGFSDITGLLWHLASLELGAIHGPVLTTISDEPEWSLQRLFDAVEGRPLSVLTGKGWGSGKAEGILLAANLTVATHLLGTAIQPSLEKVILAFEDVGEVPYRLDRFLTQWRMAGALENVRGIALGRFSQSGSINSQETWTVERVLRDRLGNLGIPVVSDLPFGHDGVNAALPVGSLVTLDAEKGTLNFQS